MNSAVQIVSDDDDEEYEYATTQMSCCGWVCSNKNKHDEVKELKELLNVYAE